MRMRALRAIVKPHGKFKGRRLLPLDVSTVRALERCQCLLNSVLHGYIQVRQHPPCASADIFAASTQQMPVLFTQPTILVLGRCQRLLNGSPYGHLHMKQPPRYTVNRTHIIAIQRACCPPVYRRATHAVPCSLLYDLLSRLASRPQPVGSLPLAQNA